MSEPIGVPDALCCRDGPSNDGSEDMTPHLATTTIKDDAMSSETAALAASSHRRSSSPTPDTQKGGVGFIGRGIEKIKQAVEADSAGNYENAFSLYYQGIDLMVVALKWEVNPRLKEVIQDRIVGYINRAEKLRRYLAEKRKPLSTASWSSARGLVAGMPSSVDNDPPSVSWNEVAGLADVKLTLLEAAVLPIKFPQLFIGPRQPVTRVLLYGPSGTGKRTLAKALAWEANRSFLAVSGSELGHGGRPLGTIFETARQYKPTIVFIDQIDALFTRPESRNTMSELQVELNGVARDKYCGVIVLASTKAPWLVDSFLLNCFQKTLHIGMPNLLGRKMLFQKRITEILSQGTPCEVAPSDCEELADMSDGYSGKDINETVQAALMIPVRKIQEATHYKTVTVEGIERVTPCSPADPAAVEMSWTKVPSTKLLEPPVQLRDFITAIKSYKDTVSDAEVKRIATWTTAGQ